jgi:hypothetical protein
MVYSDVHAKRQDSKIFWMDSVGDEVVKKPVLEVDIQKNKISEFKGALYYKFSPEYSKFYECSGEEVASWKKEYETALKHVMDKKYPDEGENPFVSGKTVDSF